MYVIGLARSGFNLFDLQYKNPVNTLTDLATTPGTSKCIEINIPAYFKCIVEQATGLLLTDAADVLLLMQEVLGSFLG